MCVCWGVWECVLLKHLLSKTFKMLLIFDFSPQEGKRGSDRHREQLATRSPIHHQPEDTISLSDYQPSALERGSSLMEAATRTSGCSGSDTSN